MTVSGTDKQQELVRRFLRIVEDNTSSQVLIEAKVLEVTLNDSYQTGIDWRKLNTHNKSLYDLDTVTPSVANSTIAAPSVTLISSDIFKSGIDFAAAIHLLDEFGTTRALSSPRLHAMNNQRALLSFAEGLVYFNVKISTTDAVLGLNNQVITPAKVDVTSTQQTTPIGISLALQPVIDAKSNEVTLDIHPTLTRLSKTVNDPGFDISKATAIAILSSSNASPTVINGLNSITSPIPQIETRELDSIVKVKSGQTLVVGGLLQDSVENSEAGVPGVDEVPWFGNLFKSVTKTNTKKELVIFLRATIVASSSPPDKADKTLYEKFGNDPRPLNFNQQ